MSGSPAQKIAKMGAEPAIDRVSVGNGYLCCMNERFKYWLKRVGWLGFLFFLIKGLLWILIPYLIAQGILSK